MSAPISGSTRLAAVIGSPVSHSLSPTLHNCAFEASRLDWRFVALEVAPGDAHQAVKAMKTLNIAGLAVTMPHKADVAAAVDQVDPAAAALGAVNTVVLRPDGSTFGASTDGAGFIASVESTGVSISGLRVVVFGAGGAARSIIDALARSGAADIVVVNRSHSSADSAAALAPVARVGDPADVKHAELLVNATPVGMGPDATKAGDMVVDPALLRSDMVVADIVYHPLTTTMLRSAALVGAATIDGLGMLVHQAALQQRLWTGHQPDVALMRSAAEAELAARSA